MNQKIIEKAKNHFYQVMKDTWPDRYDLCTHVPEAAAWAKKIAGYYPKADLEVLLLSAWLHDISHYIALQENIDHAVLSEKMAKEFLFGIKYNEIKIPEVLHCIRSHRCKDVMPRTLEARIFACTDSASHFTWGRYIIIARDLGTAGAISKLERDFRDLAVFPETQELLRPLYKDWKKILNDYDKLDL